MEIFRLNDLNLKLQRSLVAREQSKIFLEGRRDLKEINILEKWRLLLIPSEVDKAVAICASKIIDYYVKKNRPLVLVYILQDALQFTTKLIQLLDIPYTMLPVQVSSSQEELVSPLDPDLFVDKEVVILDVLYDKGEIMEIVRTEIMKLGVGPWSITTCALFNKNKNRGPHIVGLKLPNVSLVGFGLDDAGEKRGWEAVYACPKMPKNPLTEDDLIFSDESVYGNVLNEINENLY